MSKNESKVTMNSITIEELFAREDVEREYLLKPFFKERQPIMIYSRTGLGKSFFTLSIALAIAGGGGFAGYVAPKPRKVAYFDGEMSLEDLQSRIKSLIALMKLDRKIVNDNFNLIPRTHQDIKKSLPDLNSEEEAELIIDYVRKYNIDVAVFDNYSTLVNSVEDENSASGFNNTMNLLQELSKCGTASILVHHSGKNNSKSNYRGSSKMAVLMESIIKLDDNPNAKFDEVSFKVLFEKFRQKQTQETLDRVLTLREEWIAEEDTDSLEAKVVGMLESLNYAVDKEIYVQLGISQSSFSKLKKKILAKGLIHLSEWSNCLSKARDLKTNTFEIEDEDIEEVSDY